MRSITISTIKKNFPNEWVLLADPQMEGTEVKSGIAIFHHKDKKELTLQGKNLIGGHANYRVIYTGKLPNIHRLGILRKLKSI
jgi:hypothetical protein